MQGQHPDLASLFTFRSCRDTALLSVSASESIKRFVITLTIVMAAMVQEPEEIKDMEAFLKMAKYPLVKHTDMTQEMREEAMDTCITAVEKHHADMEKCTQVSFPRCGGYRSLAAESQLRVFQPAKAS